MLPPAVNVFYLQNLLCKCHLWGQIVRIFDDYHRRPTFSAEILSAAADVGGLGAAVTEGAPVPDDDTAGIEKGVHPESMCTVFCVFFPLLPVHPTSSCFFFCFFLFFRVFFFFSCGWLQAALPPSCLRSYNNFWYYHACRHNDWPSSNATPKSKTLSASRSCVTQEWLCCRRAQWCYD
jgi:hypothetical protein